MNSDNIAISYANDSNLLYSTHYAILASEVVSYEQPVGDFILSYVTPHMSSSNAEEKTDSNKDKNVLNKDNLGTDKITCSNTIKLRVPRYMFYIKNSVIIGNKTPCSCNLAMGISDGVLNATKNAAKSIYGQMETAVSGTKNGYFQTAMSIANQIVPSYINMPDTASILAMLNAVQSTNVAATTAGNTRTADQNVATAVTEATSHVTAGVQTKVKNKITAPSTSSNKTTADKSTKQQSNQNSELDDMASNVIKAAEILRRTGSLASIVSSSSKIGKASSIAGIMQIIQSALVVAREIEAIIEILGVPGRPTVEAAKTAAGVNVIPEAASLAKEAAAGATGHSFGEILKMISEDIKKVSDMANRVGKMATQIGQLTGLKTNFINQATNTINQAYRVATSATTLAQSVSKDNASLADILSAAGATSAEIASALGANTVSSLALSAGMSAAQTAKAINDTVNRTTTRAETAEAAKRAAVGSAGATAFQLTGLMISTAINTANQLGLLSTNTAKDIGATMGMINAAQSLLTTQIANENTTKEVAVQAIAQAKAEGKTIDEQIMFGIDKATEIMQALGGSPNDIGRAAVNTADIIMKQLGLSNDERLSRLSTFAKEALNLNGRVSVSDIGRVVTLGVSTIAGWMAADKAKKEGKSSADQMQAGADGTATYITDKAEGSVPPDEAAEHVGNVSKDVGSNKSDLPVDEVTTKAGDIGKEDYLNRVPPTPTPGPIIGVGAGGNQVDPREQRAEEIKQQVAANSAAKDNIDAKNINKDLTHNEPNTKDTAYNEASTQAEASTNNTAFCGIGTSSPVVINIRKEYFKGTKFIIANADDSLI